MPLKLRLDLGLGHQPLKLAGIIIVAWLVLSFALLHDRIGDPTTGTGRDMVVLIAFPPVLILLLVGLLRWLGGPPR